MRSNTLLCLAATVLSIGLSPGVGHAAVDEDAAVAVLKRNECTKCHDVAKTKKGPSYKKVAAKYKDKPRAEAERKLLDNITKEPMVKLEDGTEQKHKVIDTTDMKELKNLLEFILSR